MGHLALDSWWKVGSDAAPCLPDLEGHVSLPSASFSLDLMLLMHSPSTAPLESEYLSHYSSSVGPWTVLYCFVNTKL